MCNNNVMLAVSTEIIQNEMWLWEPGECYQTRGGFTDSHPSKMWTSKLRNQTIFSPLFPHSV